MPSAGRVMDLGAACAGAPAAQRTAAAAVTRGAWRFIVRLSCCGDLDRLNDVAHVACRIPERLHRLALPRAIPRAHAQVVCAARRREAERELAERIASQVLPQPGRTPALSAIGRECDLAHSLAAIEG